MRAGTKKSRVKVDGDDLLPEYDFTRAVRGKHVRISREPGNDWGASAPYLPGCVATGKTLDSTLRRIEVAIELHLAGLRADGIRPPRPGHAAIRPLKTAHRVDVYATVQVRAAATSRRPSTERPGAARRLAGAAQVRETTSGSRGTRASIRRGGCA